uniref:Integrin subunit alpha M n=1 Tax=Nomascus leucogenys TaxID=61853 RepID=G1S2M6_NOMLE
MALRVLLLTALTLCHGFNLDTENAMTFQENARGFGQSVVQLQGSRVVVGAPQEILADNQRGSLYQCDYSIGSCEPIHLQVPVEAVNMSLGLSLAATTSPPQLLACGPTVHQTCSENTYVKGLCFLFGSNLRQQPQKFPEALRGCPQEDSDIAFLIDGSGSINPNDFQKMKEFVSTVMEQLKKSKTLFSLMQYSEEFWTHFTFKEFQDNPNPRSLVKPIMQLFGRTHTATGIRKVVRELFNITQGARKNAFKILVVITDGEKFGDPLGYEDVIPEADREGVIRYVIGVGDAFHSMNSRQELNTIASKPPRDHVFQVNNFEALKTIQNQLREKIFAIEGTQTGSSSSFEHEMSQEGFSTAITSNGLLLSTVGSYDWAGGAFLYTSKEKSTFINMTRVDSDMNDAYLIGAYFGASLCSVDVDSNGSTDLVLIGAPHYYEQTRGGQVSMCPLPRGQRARWQCDAVLYGEQGQPWGRFGAALTVLGDVNGDKLTDVAIGAPGEEDNRGAVYLFHGTLGLGINPSHSQRIAGSKLSPRLQYFGQSLSGGQDLTMDGLVDLTVGAQGHVLLLRSQPVLRVKAIMEFNPREVARNVFECNDQVVKGKEAGEVRVCLHVQKSTRDRLTEGQIQSVVTYDLALDSGRTHSRAVFNETKNNTRRGTQVLGLTQTCETLKLQLPNCVEDPVRPIVLHLNFSLVGTPLSAFGNLRPVLAEDAQRLFTALVTFNITFDVDSKASLGNKLLLKAKVTSENNMPRTNKTEFQLELPVKYAVYMVVTSHEVSTKYLSFTASENTSQVMQHQYQVSNLGQRSLPISLVFLVPVRLNQAIIWDRPQVTFPENLSSTCHTKERLPLHSDFLAELRKAPLVNCAIAVCHRIQCDFPFFGIQEEFNATLKGNLSFDWYIKTSHNHLLVVSTAEILFNDSTFTLLPGQGAFVRAQTETKVEPFEVPNPLPLIVGSSVGGLMLLALITAALYKLGFFKRQYKDMMSEGGPPGAEPQ